MSTLQIILIGVTIILSASVIILVLIWGLKKEPENLRMASLKKNYRNLNEQLMIVQRTLKTESEARAKAENQLKAETDARTKAEAKLQAEAAILDEYQKAIDDINGKLRVETEARVKAEKQAKAEAEARAKAEQSLEVVAKKLEAEVKVNEELKQKLEAEVKGRATTKQHAQIEVEARKRAEKKVQTESAARAKAENQLKAETDARTKAEQKAQAESAERVKQIQTLTEKLQTEAKARADAEKQIQILTDKIKAESEVRADKLRAEIDGKAKKDEPKAQANAKVETKDDAAGNGDEPVDQHIYNAVLAFLGGHPDTKDAKDIAKEIGVGIKPEEVEAALRKLVKHTLLDQDHKLTDLGMKTAQECIEKEKEQADDNIEST